MAQLPPALFACVFVKDAPTDFKITLACCSPQADAAPVGNTWGRTEWLSSPAGLVICATRVVLCGEAQVWDFSPSSWQCLFKCRYASHLLLAAATAAVLSLLLNNSKIFFLKVDNDADTATHGCDVGLCIKSIAPCLCSLKLISQIRG